ncbi:MAG TPA: 5-(carboxyamino)imidazole ribonucleotide mutase [Bacillota bacterium]|nr:5-(carboxyamino)imidazole ribonucleotide mutase [Bacillota bacterium]HPZ54230.1 5-(carboxyamino)imidazole ribonucleotide mutase [Bacillota bacterium]HQD18708.1 5-(carboxyamino)imidazole ribonucleotide mutase [Bacillota bacterium]
MSRVDVGIVMGSDSDLPVMEKAAEVLSSFGVSFEMSVISAHRTPHKAAAYAESADERGLKVIIAGAGGAAHLAGVMASLTAIPVIGVPITSQLQGIDSLLSTVQMPSGVPVATVGVNAAKNAGLLAVEILALSDRVLKDRLKAYRSELVKEVERKNQAIQASRSERSE